MAKSRKKKTSQAKMEERLYKKYKESYAKYKAIYKYNMGPMLSKKNFLEAYKDYKEAGSYHPITNIVKDQRETSAKQAQVWAQNLKKKVKEWKKLEPDELTDLQSELIYMTPAKMDKNFFMKQDKQAKEILDLIASQDAWDETVGS